MYPRVIVTEINRDVLIKKKQRKRIIFIENTKGAS